MAVETVLTLADVIIAIKECVIGLKEIKDVTSTIGSSNNDVVNALTIGTSDINSQLLDINIHLGNIEAIGRLLLQFMIVIVVFKGLYFILDKVFFNDC